MNDKEIRSIVNNFKTKNKEGFTESELQELVDMFPRVNMVKFKNAFFGNTCMRINNETVNYHCDVITALKCGIENRDMLPMEFD